MIPPSLWVCRYSHRDKNFIAVVFFLPKEMHVSIRPSFRLSSNERCVTSVQQSRTLFLLPGVRVSLSSHVLPIPVSW